MEIGRLGFSFSGIFLHGDFPSQGFSSTGIFLLRELLLFTRTFGTCSDQSSLPAEILYNISYLIYHSYLMYKYL
jgi:hypothetical protein